MIENYSQNIDHMTLRPGIYLRACHHNIFYWDLRLVIPNTEKGPVPQEAIHSLEHLLAQYLREVLEDDYVGVFAMGCCTGLSILTTATMDMYDNFQGILLKTLNDIYRNATKVPFATIRECGNFRCHSLDKAKEAIYDFQSSILTNFLFLNPMPCEFISTGKAIEKYFSYANTYNYCIGVGKSNAAFHFGRYYIGQPYVCLLGFAGTCSDCLRQGDVVFPSASYCDDINDVDDILKDLKTEYPLLGDSPYKVSSSDSFVTSELAKGKGYTKYDDVIFDMEAHPINQALHTSAETSRYRSQMIVARMISDNVFSDTQVTDFNIFKEGRDFSDLLLGCLKLSKQFARIPFTEQD